MMGNSRFSSSSRNLLISADDADNTGYWIHDGFGPVYVPTCGINYFGFYVCG